MFASSAAKHTTPIANTAATPNKIALFFMNSPLINSQLELETAAHHTPIQFISLDAIVAPASCRRF
jgi:hypothetical protein